ncbi:ATP-binding protein [Nocardioides taihuensis]|uniref:ATP-binding protein n=1 Tax=Nocardioides taihuensis TaxID=1835606 RepID=A0ABW0BNS8_9ACTN
MDLLERDREVSVLDATLAAAAGGEGGGVAVAGDSGTGKSSVVDAAVSARDDLRVLRGACDPLSTPRPLGPFRDLAGLVGLERLLRGDEALLSTVCEELYDALRAAPSVLVVEDLHWVDAASAEVLRFLARRVESLPLALLVTYRGHEVGPRHSARPLLGDFARLEGLRSLDLAPLSLAAVTAMVDGTRLDPARVHGVTGGNPFFVAEVVKDPDRPLPASVRDAVLGRTGDLDPADFEVLQLVATAPDRLDDRVLPVLGIDLPTLRRIDTTGLITRARGGLLFRHELARQAVESTIPAGGGPRLHASLLEALERSGLSDPAVLTHHAVAARDSVRAASYAREAAEEASHAGSHTEAAAFYATALEHLGDSADLERADLLVNVAFQQYMTSRLPEAIANARASFRLYEAAGDAAGFSRAQAAAAVYEYYNARRRRAEDLVQRAEATGDDSSFGEARATHGYLAYMANDYDFALGCYVDAEGWDDRALLIRGWYVRDSTRLSAGEHDARARLVDHVEEARELGYDELASTGYSNLAYLDVEHRRYRLAEHVLEESIPFTVERDIPICRHWQTAIRSRMHFNQGHWSAALEDADRVLHEDGMPLATLWPHVVTGLVALRRGEPEPSGSGLEEAWRLAEQIEEPLRWLPVLAGLAERTWITGEKDRRVTDDAPARLAELGTMPGTAWAAGDLALWLRRVGVAAEPPGEVAEPFRLALEGRHEEAASWWHQVGEPFAEAMAWADSTDPAPRVRAVEILDQLGAFASADRLRHELRAAGVSAVPPRPRASTMANPAGLTNRQLDVARLVARGFTNAEIAARLFISPKTTDHHVSAVLAKLGLPNRRAVVVQADELGLS